MKILGSDVHHIQSATPYLVFRVCQHHLHEYLSLIDVFMSLEVEIHILNSNSAFDTEARENYSFLVFMGLFWRTWRMKDTFSRTILSTPSFVALLNKTGFYMNIVCLFFNSPCQRFLAPYSSTLACFFSRRNQINIIDKAVFKWSYFAAAKVIMLQKPPGWFLDIPAEKQHNNFCSYAAVNLFFIWREVQTQHFIPRSQEASHLLLEKEYNTLKKNTHTQLAYKISLNVSNFSGSELLLLLKSRAFNSRLGNL